MTCNADIGFGVRCQKDTGHGSPCGEDTPFSEKMDKILGGNMSYTKRAKDSNYRAGDMFRVEKTNVSSPARYGQVGDIYMLVSVKGETGLINHKTGAMYNNMVKGYALSLSELEEVMKGFVTEWSGVNVEYPPAPQYTVTVDRYKMDGQYIDRMELPVRDNPALEVEKVVDELRGRKYAGGNNSEIWVLTSLPTRIISASNWKV
jgi:hypothetical protein